MPKYSKTSPLRKADRVKKRGARNFGDLSWETANGQVNGTG
jgi:hypothetical protein